VGEKTFFFEKKNQKTFLCLAGDVAAGALRGGGVWLPALLVCTAFMAIAWAGCDRNYAVVSNNARQPVINFMGHTNIDRLASGEVVTRFGSGFASPPRMQVLIADAAMPPYPHQPRAAP
jgi:hypothetical protein